MGRRGLAMREIGALSVFLVPAQTSVFVAFNSPDKVTQLGHWRDVW